jgi:hypothetical protein
VRRWQDLIEQSGSILMPTSQLDSILQPKVAQLPWVIAKKSSTPTGLHRRSIMHMDSTHAGLIQFVIHHPA